MRNDRHLWSLSSCLTNSMFSALVSLHPLRHTGEETMQVLPSRAMSVPCPFADGKPVQPCPWSIPGVQGADHSWGG